MTDRFRPRHLLAAVASVALLTLTGCAGTAAPVASIDSEAGATGDWVVARDLEPAMGSSEADGVFPRSVSHFGGVTEIAAAPERVAVVSTGQLDALLTLGQVPAAATRAENSGLVPAYLSEAFPQDAAALDAMTDIGQRTEPDLEAIAQAAPDLILINATRGAELYDALSAIAPTVVTRGNGVNWKSDFLLIADALGDEGVARGILDSLQSDSAAFAATHANGDPTVSFLQSTGDRTRIMGVPSFAAVRLVVAPVVSTERNRRLRIDVARCQGGKAGQSLVVEIDDEAPGDTDPVRALPGLASPAAGA